MSHIHDEQYVFINFRELLWYWTEYYTRRGRDRLSLEFSTHVPFYKWKEIVGMYSSSPSRLVLLIPQIHFILVLTDSYDRLVMP